MLPLLRTCVTCVMSATPMLTYLRLFVRVLHKLFSLDGVHIENGKRGLKSS